MNINPENSKLINNPDNIAFGGGDHTFTVADWTVSSKRPMKGADGETFEEDQFHDVVGTMEKLDLM